MPIHRRENRLNLTQQAPVQAQEQALVQQAAQAALQSDTQINNPIMLTKELANFLFELSNNESLKLDLEYQERVNNCQT